MALDFYQIGAGLLTQGRLTTEQRLNAYYEAEYQVLKAGQGYTVEERQRQSAQLSEIRTAIKELEAQLAAEQAAVTGTSDCMGLIQFGPTS